MVSDTKELTMSLMKQETSVCPKQGHTMPDPTLEKALSL